VRRIHSDGLVRGWDGRLPEIKSRPSTKLKQQIHERDGRICQYCGTRRARFYTVEHMVSMRRNGPHHPVNLVIACWECNGAKENAIVIPRNFDTITVEYPRWAAEIRRVVAAEEYQRTPGYLPINFAATELTPLRLVLYYYVSGEPAYYRAYMRPAAPAPEEAANG
jgi:hypothetical protein